MALAMKKVMKAAAKSMKKAAMKVKSMKAKKVMKVMKVKKVKKAMRKSVVAKGRMAKVLVFKGARAVLGVGSGLYICGVLALDADVAIAWTVVSHKGNLFELLFKPELVRI